MKIPMRNPNRPPKAWFDSCRKSGKSPRLCGWIWYRRVKPSTKKKIIASVETSRRGVSNPLVIKSLKIYVGAQYDENITYQVFKSYHEPTQRSHGKIYRYVIGPFRTMRAAKIMALYGRNNPHLQCVADAEFMAAKGTEWLNAHGFQAVL